VADPLALLQATFADRYAIERELGRGGMATVYLARDLKHERPVALKVLTPSWPPRSGRPGFCRKSGSPRACSTPTSCRSLTRVRALAGSGTPFVEGESLRQRLVREKQLPVEEALHITKDVVEALAHAHTHGVVHRDIKPENILLKGGRAIVADFGIARAVDAAGAERLTETGLALGTPAYISPEQSTGQRDVDGRSDMYSLACVLYEMLAGEPPFTGPTAQVILARHSLDPVPSLRTARRTVPLGMEQAIVRALAKVPARVGWETIRRSARSWSSPPAQTAGRSSKLIPKRAVSPCSVSITICGEGASNLVTVASDEGGALVAGSVTPALSPQASARVPASTPTGMSRTRCMLDLQTKGHDGELY
jgi:eukaryotic-like serine/threonine-protein kinase